MGEKREFVKEKEDDVVFELYLRSDYYCIHITRNLYCMATLLAEATGYWGVAHVFLSLLSLIDNRTSYMRHILSKLFLVKAGKTVEKVDGEEYKLAPSSLSFSFSYS